MKLISKFKYLVTMVNSSIIHHEKTQMSSVCSAFGQLETVMSQCAQGYMTMMDLWWCSQGISEKNLLSLTLPQPCLQWCHLLGQHHWISQNGHCAGSTSIQGWVRWDWWCDCDQIQSGMVRGWLVEIGASHQIWWNILREHNWGVPSAHINFIYYVTDIVEYLIMLQGHMHTGTYTILYLHAWELLFPWSVWEHLKLCLGSTGQK